MSLLPSRPDTSEADDADPRVIGVNSEDADDVLAALSSDTARTLLQEIHGKPATPSELADRVDTSVQNVQYHLGNLEDAGAIEVVDTAYSEKGREMNVYAAADKPLVIYAGDDDEESTLRTALSRLLGPVGMLGIASLAIQSTFGESVIPFGGGDGSSGADGSGGGGAGGTDGGDGAAEDEYTDGDSASGDGGDTADGGDGTSDGGDTATDGGDSADGGDVTQAVDDNGTQEPTQTPEEMESPTPDGFETPTPDGFETPTPEAVDTATDAAASLPPGLVFFAGGLFVLGVVGVVQYYR